MEHFGFDLANHNPVGDLNGFGCVNSSGFSTVHILFPYDHNFLLNSEVVFSNSSTWVKLTPKTLSFGSNTPQT